jgi:hypothetical protein
MQNRAANTSSSLLARSRQQIRGFRVHAPRSIFGIDQDRLTQASGEGYRLPVSAPTERYRRGSSPLTPASHCWPNSTRRPGRGNLRLQLTWPMAARPNVFRPGRLLRLPDLQALQDDGDRSSMRRYDRSPPAMEALVSPAPWARPAPVLAGAVLRAIRRGVGRVRSALRPSTSECLGVNRTLLAAKPFDDE